MPTEHVKLHYRKSQQASLQEITTLDLSQGHQATERLSNFSKVTQLVRNTMELEPSV